MPRKPRLVDLLGKPKKRRPLVTQDGTVIARDEALPASCIGEAMPIWGDPIAMDERLPFDPSRVTFDGGPSQRQAARHLRPAPVSSFVLGQPVRSRRGHAPG